MITENAVKRLSLTNDGDDRNGTEAASPLTGRMPKTHGNHEMTMDGAQTTTTKTAACTRWRILH